MDQQLRPFFLFTILSSPMKCMRLKFAIESIHNKFTIMSTINIVISMFIFEKYEFSGGGILYKKARPIFFLTTIQSMFYFLQTK